MKKICRDCGRIIEEGEEFLELDGEYLCQDCQDNYFYCDECGSFEDRDNGYYVESNDRYVCESCLDYYYNRCEDCGEYFRDGDGYTINDGDGGYYSICLSCYDNGDYYYCDECGDLFYVDNIHFTDDGDYCNGCYSQNNGGIYGYHSFNDWRLFKGSNEENVPYYIGKEIELDPLGSGNVKGVVNAINLINAVGMHDGSLDYNGVEVVTHPESWEYLQENKEKYVKFFEEIKNIKYGNDGRCGLHFHVTRPNDNVTSRVIVLLESFKNEIKKLSRRNENQLRSWAKFLTDGSSDDNIKYQSTKYLKDTYVKGWHDRYYALNLQNSKTIEFRFFNGVNNFEEFWSALQFIHNIMELALDEDRELNTINWKDLLDGDELITQASKQGVLNVDKFAKDTTDIMEKYEEIVDKTKKEIKRILKNMAKYINKEMSELDIKRIKDNNLDNMYSKCDGFIDDFRHRFQYLNKIVDLYRALEGNISLTIGTIKDYWNNTKSSYPVNTQRYKRYDSLIEKAIKNFEKEMN